MDIWILIAPIIASVVLQLTKRILKVDSKWLPVIGAILGAASNGLLALVNQDQAGLTTALTMVAGAIITPGTHSAVLHTTPLGRILKGVSEVATKPEPPKE